MAGNQRIWRRPTQTRGEHEKPGTDSNPTSGSGHGAARQQLYLLECHVIIYATIMTLLHVTLGALPVVISTVLPKKITSVLRAPPLWINVHAQMFKSTIHGRKYVDTWPWNPYVVPPQSPTKKLVTHCCIGCLCVLYSSVTVSLYLALTSTWLNTFWDELQHHRPFFQRIPTAGTGMFNKHICGWLVRCCEVLHSWNVNI